MTASERDRARQRLAEAFVREAARNRFHPPPHCNALTEEQREAYLRDAVHKLADVVAARTESDQPEPLR